MGIDINEHKAVSFNEHHDHRLVTCPTKNPKTTTIEDLLIHSIYRRTKTGDFRRDGNPFIYALKSKDGYKITNRELHRFKPSFYTILTKIIEHKTVDYILPMPSSHPIAHYLARRLARATDATVIDDFFCKQTTGNIIATFDLASVKPAHKKDVKKQLAAYRKMPANTLVSLKKIPNKIRCYFPPLVLNPGNTVTVDIENVLLVDDLLSTGTTLLSAKRLLRSRNLACVCLLSDL